MKVRYIKKADIEKKANDLLSKYPDVKNGTNIDVIALATKHLGLKLRFLDLKSIYGTNTLGMLFDDKLIICDESLEPLGKNKNNLEEILRFTIAHEIGHYVQHSDYMNSKNPIYFHKNLSEKEQDRLETQANIFAASLLMPADKFKASYHHIVNNLGYNDYTVRKALSEKFSVSKKSAGFRIKNLGL